MLLLQESSSPYLSRARSYVRQAAVAAVVWRRERGRRQTARLEGAREEADGTCLGVHADARPAALLRDLEAVIAGAGRLGSPGARARDVIVVIRDGQELKSAMK